MCVTMVKKVIIYVPNNFLILFLDFGKVLEHCLFLSYIPLDLGDYHR